MKSSQSEIKKSYRQLALELHPDKISLNITQELREELKETFLRVQEAYETLGDEEKRIQYDYSLSGIQYDIIRKSELEKYSYGRFETFVRSKRIKFHLVAEFDKPRISDLIIRLNIPLADTFKDIERPHSFFRRLHCPHCQGMGGECRMCTLCSGTGEAAHYGDVNNRKLESLTRMKCLHCKGSGCIVVAQCSHCGGSRFEMNETNIVVSLHAGFMNGAQGHQHEDGRFGDVYINCFYVLPPGWSLDEQRGVLRVEVQVPLLDMLTGVERPLTLPSGERLQIGVRPNISIFEALSGIDIAAPNMGVIINPMGGRGLLEIHVSADWSQLTMASLRQALLSTGLSELDDNYHRIIAMFQPTGASDDGGHGGADAIEEGDIQILHKGDTGDVGDIHDNSI